MILNFTKFLLVIILFYQTPVYSKIYNNSDFNSKNLSSYFSALLSSNNKKNSKALEHFNLSRSLINEHDPYLKNYVNSLVIEGEISKEIKKLKFNLNKKNSNFFEGYLLLVLDSIKKKDFKESKKYLKKISNFTENGTFELVIYESLKNFIYLFENKKILIKDSNLGNLSSINRLFENCYLGEKNTEVHFLNLINTNDVNYSRYIFFYINYLIERNKYEEIDKLSNQIDILNTNLLILQSKQWIDEKNLKNFTNIFSCKNENDILAEFIFLIANLYSSENNFEKSNFYSQISFFLNPKFIFNLSLMAENHYMNENYKECKKILESFNKKNSAYNWYKIKKKAHIIAKEQGHEKSFSYLDSNFKKIKNPSTKLLLDMANISKSFEKYNIAIDYYTKVLSRMSKNETTYADILYKRGGSYERLGDFSKSDDDLLLSLEINPGDAYTLNYLAYSWLERNYKIDIAIEMLETAYSKKENDPYIIDSIGWAYYLIGDFFKAEQLMKRALQLMPDDPIVNDHYGDILWSLNRKMQAQYYWKSVLNFEDTEESMKEKINIKLLKGPKNI